MKQLLLGIKLNDYAKFENFYSENNAFIVDCLQHFISDDESLIYLSGQQGSGKSHLLQSCCHLANQQNKRAFYLSLAQSGQLDLAMFQSLESFDLICLDDIDYLLPNQQWEEAIFHLYNRARDVKSKLLVAAKQPPTALSFHLLDLQSRLQWGVGLHLEPLSDDGKLNVLQSCANSRGFQLSRAVASFLINHYPRHMHDLMAALDKLDQASLQQQRSLTIPFIKQTLS